MNHRSWVAFSGFTWLCIGSFLLYKGLRFISEGVFSADSLCFQLQGVCGSAEQAATLLIAFGLLVGFVKGRTVLAKSVKRVTGRIVGLPLPIRARDVYAPAYGILIGCMMLLGMLLKVAPIWVDLRGAIDVAIGSALINGAMLYFRAARSICGTYCRD